MCASQPGSPIVAAEHFRVLALAFNKVWYSKGMPTGGLLLSSAAVATIIAVYNCAYTTAEEKNSSVLLGSTAEGLIAVHNFGRLAPSSDVKRVLLNPTTTKLMGRGKNCVQAKISL